MRDVSCLMNWSLSVLGVAVMLYVHAAFPTTQASEIPAYIAPPHRAVLEKWLSTNKTSRVATDEDCNCSDDIARMRRGYGGTWKPNPDFHPYYVAGDFNGDGHTDFAVVVIGGSTSSTREVAIFNGPFSPSTAKSPVYLSGKRAGALFFGPPRSKPWRLIVGPFESEGSLLMPKGSTYVLTPSNCC
jgi:hypothetical protein